MNLKTFEDMPLICKIVWICGIVYLFVTFIHFGVYFYDLDKLITNLAVSVIILGFGWVVKKTLEQREDIKTIVNRQNKFENK